MIFLFQEAEFLKTPLPLRPNFWLHIAIDLERMSAGTFDLRFDSRRTALLAAAGLGLDLAWLTLTGISSSSHRLDRRHRLCSINRSSTSHLSCLRDLLSNWIFPFIDTSTAVGAQLTA
jgi:hypothetical protein